ncbi:MAG: hypothetical protein Q7S38_01915 [bacterium]|nr:hypothetical protein [bacterium]
MSKKLILGAILFSLFGFLMLSHVNQTLAGSGNDGSNIVSPSITSVNVGPCTSSSCIAVTTIFINGNNFAPDAQVKVFGLTDGTYYSGQTYVVIAGRTSSTQIIADLYSLPCYQRYAVAVQNPGGGFTVSTDVFGLNNSCLSLKAVNFATNYAYLTADNFYIDINGQRFFANKGNVQVHSDPGNPGYTTLETVWYENGVEMRLFLYFKTVGNEWVNYEMRTYGGAEPGKWIYYTGITNKGRTPSGGPKLGTPLTLQVGNIGPDLGNPSNTRNASISASVHFENLRMQAFLNRMAPTISYIAPPLAEQGAMVKIVGSGFFPTASDNKIFVGGSSMPTQFNNVSFDGKTLNFLLTTEIPFEIGKRYEVWVENPNGKSNKYSIIVTSPIRLLSVNPNPAIIGNTLILRGMNFGSRGIVYLENRSNRIWANAEVLRWTNNFIMARVPNVPVNQVYTVQIEGLYRSDYLSVSNSLPLRVRLR